MPSELKILFVEDIPADVELAQRILKKGRIAFVSNVVQDEAAFLHALSEFLPDIVISDLAMPQFDGMAALNLLLINSPSTPFILLTGAANEETAVDFLKNGAADYILKEHITRLPLAVKDAIEKNKIILEKEKVKLDLIKSEERYRSLYENINIGLFRSTPEGKVLLANTALIKMLGYASFKELEDLDLQKEGYARSYDRIKFINKIEKQGEVIGLESEWIKKDGTTIHIIENAKAIRDADGKTLYYDGTVENITERKNSENALRKSKTDLLEAQRVGRLGSWDWDAITDTITWSEEYYQIYGYDPKLRPPGYEEHLKVYTQESAQRLDIAVKESMKTGEGYQVDLELVSPLNTTRWVTARGEVKYDNERKIIGLRGTAQDITDRKRAEEELKKKNTFIQTVLDNLPIGIALNEIDKGNTFYTNKKFEEVYGWSKDEMKDISVFFKKVYPDKKYREELMTKIMADIQSGDPSRMHWEDCIVTHKDGSKHIVNAVNIPLSEQNTMVSTVIDITERKRVEEEIAMLAHSLRSVNECVSITDMENKILFINESFLKTYGYDENELNGKHISILRSLDKAPELVGEILPATIRGGWQGELWNKRKDGSEFQIYLSTTIINDKDGKPLGLIGVATDITERKLAADSLFNEKLLLRTLIDNIPDSIYSKDLNCKKTLVNLAEVRNVGAKSEAEILGKDDFDFYPKEIAEGFFADDQSVLITGEPVINREEYILDENGEKRWLLSSKLPLRDKDDKIIGLVGIGRDITERKQAEESLKEREEYYRFIVETTNSVMYRLNYASMKYEHLDESIKNLIGYTPEEINEIGFKNLIVKISKYHVEKINVDILIDERKQGKTLEWRADYLLKAKDGKLVWLADHSFPLTNESGAIFGSFGVLRDITESKNAEQDLLQAKERAEQMNRLKSNFLANMSHELRTPLNGILGYAEILTSMLIDPEQIEMIEGIYQSGKRLSETLKFILDLSDAETDKIEVVSKTIEVIQAVKKCINSFIHEAEKKNILLETIVKGENLYGSLDENLFMRVIYNLVDNALKFTKEGKISVEIGPEVIDAKEWFYVKIKDTGIGIPSDKIDLIWEEFRQVSEGLTRSFEGPGLGLTISKKAVNLMHGQISVESELGTGSTFTVKFPMVQALQKEELLQEKQIDTLPETKRDFIDTPLSLGLYVEDDSANRHIVKLFLKNISVVETANDGETALQLAAEKKYDFILMDINLRGEMNGMEVVREILKMPQYVHTPIIAVTAYAMEKDKAEFLKSGFTHYISKPFKKSDIVDLVTTVIADPAKKAQSSQ